MKLTITGAVGAFILGLGACGGGGSLTPQEFVDAQATIMCEAMFNCCPEGAGFFTTEADCVTFVSAFMPLASLEAEGLVEYDGEKASECIDALTASLSSIDCSTASGGFPEPPQSTQTVCEAAIRGTRAAGESCMIDDTSSTNVLCEGSLDCIDGVCGTAPQIGDACTFESDCDDGLYCNDDSVCAAELATGEACPSGNGCVGQCNDGVCVDADMCAG